MKRSELIASVALDFITAQMQQEPQGSLRFCMLGLEASLVRSIATAVLNDQESRELVSVKITTVFDPDGTLPEDARSDQSVTHWRHCRLADGKRAVLFAASQEELQRNDKSVEKVIKIETDTLRTRYNAWLDHAGLSAERLDVAGRKQLQTALQAIDATHVARTIETFADFILAVAESILLKGFPLQKAVDNALPSLRLPRYSGYFERIPAKKRTQKGEWNKIFRRLHTRIRPFLIRETERNEPLSEDQLRANLDKIADQLTETERRTIKAFLEADVKPDDWCDAQKALVDLDWRRISGLFEGVTKTRPSPLGGETEKFFDDEFGDQLDEQERELLAGVFPKDPSDDLQEFYEEHREELAKDKKLSGRWERYIYRNPQTYPDFLLGLVATVDSLRRRTRDDGPIENKLVVRIPNARKKSFWRGKNPRIARYFAFRYRGLGALLGPDVELDFGKLADFYFPEPDDGLAKVTSRSKEARSIKFEVLLDPDGAKATLIFYWEMPVDALATALPDDLLSVANLDQAQALLPTADIARQSVSAKGSIQRIVLNDVNTIRDVTNTNNGKLVAPNEDSGDRSGAFRSALKELLSVLEPPDHQRIGSAFEDFVGAYTKALRDWVSGDGAGLASEALTAQAEKYGAVLECLLRGANKDLARERLWPELMRLGIANVGAGVPAAIITPWHPLRLAGIKVKTDQVVRLVQDVLRGNEDDIFRSDLLFAQIERDLVSPYYPEVCIGFDKDKPMLLAAADSSYDYTLAEPPLRQARPDGDDALDVEPGVAAKRFSEVGEQYLKLLPHERSNFSVVLYNAESKALPSALASELSSKVEQENELQCDLLLTHSDPKRLRRIYEQQNVTVSNESGSLMASESAPNFLSRLRVGFCEAADLSADENGRAADLVALQDVVARNAKLVWKPAPGHRHPDLADHVPARWSRRRPIGPADTATSVYLACPAQPRVGQLYLNAVHGFLDGDNASAGDVIPAREVKFRGTDSADVFSRTHRMGEWVVNFDELVDRRLLANNGVRVVRHMPDRRIERNIVVSTTSKPRLLRVLLRERLERLDPAIVKGDDVIDGLIDQANTLSGQVVMRAARYGRYANELLGIVLSMEKIRQELGGVDFPLGWYFLDDFASWFGQREEQIADIMALAPRVEDGEPVLRIAISEAKFVASKGYRAQAKKSAKQLHETVERIRRALDPLHKRIDREIWLHRLGDFMLEGVEPFDSSKLNGWDLYGWSDEVRQNKVRIELSGFSHVFVHDDDEAVDADDSRPLKGMPHCSQQVFDKQGVTDACRSFAARRARRGQSSDDAAGWGDPLVSSRSGGSATPTTRTRLVEGGAPSEPAPVVSTHNPNPAESVAADRREIGEQPTSSTLLSASTNAPAATELANSHQNVAADYSEKWPSGELAAWVNAGRISEEEDEEAKAWLDTTVKALQRALRGYEMTAELVGVRLTPNAALVRFRGSDALTVPKVEKRRQELLTSHAVEVINVLAAPMEVVIMVARPSRTILRLRDLWRQRALPVSAPRTNTSLLLGARESNGELLYLNVGGSFGGQQPHGPHTLIAGETGSGKGVLVQCLLLDICATNAPSSARIEMIDPKAGIDFPWLRRMPHLNGDLITDRKAAIGVLEALVEEMERRNRLLAEVGVTNLSRYNQRVAPADRLARIWLFHDELADWMMNDDYRDAVELNVNRLGVKARASGINLVVVTQRPDRDALPMQLRANLGNRLLLKVADKRNSILVLDEPGAERLLGRGHLAAKLSGEGKVILAQVPFANEEEIMELAKLIEKAWTGQEIPAGQGS